MQNPLAIQGRTVQSIARTGDTYRAIMIALDKRSGMWQALRCDDYCVAERPTYERLVAVLREMGIDPKATRLAA